jgi:hypothetical protein
MKNAVRLNDLKTETKKLQLPDRAWLLLSKNADHVHKMGQLAYKMGIIQSNNPQKVESLKVTWERGWMFAQNEFMQRRGKAL